MYYSLSFNLTASGCFIFITFSLNIFLARQIFLRLKWKIYNILFFSCFCTQGSPTLGGRMVRVSPQAWSQVSDSSYQYFPKFKTFISMFYQNQIKKDEPEQKHSSQGCISVYYSKIGAILKNVVQRIKYRWCDRGIELGKIIFPGSDGIQRWNSIRPWK